MSGSQLLDSLAFGGIIFFFNSTVLNDNHEHATRENCLLPLQQGFQALLEVLYFC